MMGSYLYSTLLGPIVRQKVDTAVLGLAGSLLKVLPELVGVVDLEAGSSRYQNVGWERGNEMRDRRVQEGNDQHTPRGHWLSSPLLPVEDIRPMYRELVGSAIVLILSAEL